MLGIFHENINEISQYLQDTLHKIAKEGSYEDVRYEMAKQSS